MKQLGIVATIVLAVIVLAGSAAAQKKPVKKPVTKKPVPAKTTPVIPPLDVRAAREKVEVQLSNVVDFVNKLGPIAQGLETADEDRRAGKLSASTATSIEAGKAKVVDAIRNLKTGLATLESEFRTKTALQKYLPNIQDITNLAGEAEDSAIAGRFVAAKDPLRAVAAKLTDTLAILPK
jgi:hypothetical protein